MDPQTTKEENISIKKVLVCLVSPLLYQIPPYWQSYTVFENVIGLSRPSQGQDHESTLQADRQRSIDARKHTDIIFLLHESK